MSRHSLPTHHPPATRLHRFERDREKKRKREGEREKEREGEREFKPHRVALITKCHIAKVNRVNDWSR